MFLAELQARLMWLNSEIVPFFQHFHEPYASAQGPAAHIQDPVMALHTLLQHDQELHLAKSDKGRWRAAQEQDIREGQHALAQAQHSAPLCLLFESLGHNGHGTSLGGVGVRALALGAQHLAL